jgi:hypothetical protein
MTKSQSQAAAVDEAAARAVDFRRRIAAAGITIREFQRRTGLTRNVVYGLTKGRKPPAERQRLIESILGE